MSRTSSITEKELTKTVEYGFDNTCFQHVVPSQVEYDIYSDCYSNDCYEEGICRCSTIENAHFEPEFSNYSFNLSSLSADSIVNPFFGSRCYTPNIKKYGILNAIEKWMLQKNSF